MQNIMAADEQSVYGVIETNPKFAYGNYNAAEYLKNAELVNKTVLFAGVDNVGYSYVLFTPSKHPTKNLRLYLVEEGKGKEGERQIFEAIRNSPYRIHSIARAKNRIECAKAAAEYSERGVTPALLQVSQLFYFGYAASRVLAQ